MCEITATLLGVLADNFQSILTVISSLGSAIVGGVIAAKSTRCNETQKMLLEKRFSLYYEFNSEIEALINDRRTIFSTDYFSMLIMYKPKMKLLCSSETFKALEIFYNYVHDEYSAYQIFCNEHNPENDPQYREVIYGEDGQIDEILNLPEEELEHFEKVMKEYMRDHTPSHDEVNKRFLPLYNSMRKDIGTDRIER